MNPEEQRKEIVLYWWSKAEESLASTRRELEAGSYTFAVNRLYYAAFYGVGVALLKRQLFFSKHSLVAHNQNHGCCGICNVMHFT